ncbi:MAG: hypothetical protein R6X02_26400 [Enhygromyxa sp.]
MAAMIMAMLGACHDGQTPTVSEPAATAPEADAEAPLEAEPGELSLRVTQARCGEASDPASLPATRIEPSRSAGELRVLVHDLVYHCSPAPEFAAEVKGGALELRVLAPAPGEGARCMCPHEVALSVDGVPSDVDEVRLFDFSDGSTLAEASI